MTVEDDEVTRSPLARDETVVFVEADAKGNPRFIGHGGGNFTAPLEISTQAESLLAMMVDLDDVPLGAKVGVIRVLGPSPDKQVTVHCEVDTSGARKDYEYDANTVSDDLEAFSTD